MHNLLSRKAVMVHGALITFLAPKIAMDSKEPINIRPLLNGLTNKNFGSKKAELLSGITKAMDGKLAKDAELDHLPELLDALERTEEPEAGDNELEGTNKERQASPLRTGLDAGREFLSGKLSAEDLATFDSMCKDAAEEDDEKNKAEEEKKAKDKKAKDEKDEEDKKAQEAKDAAEAKEKEAKDKKAMDSAIKTAITAERDRQTAIRDAEKAFRPFLGEMAQAFDSAEAIYQHGLKAMGVKTKVDGLPLPALQAILESQPRPGHQPKTPSIGMDAAATKSFSEMFKTTHLPNVL